MHPHLFRSNQISYPRGCYTKRDNLTDFPRRRRKQCKSSFNGNDYIKVGYLGRKGYDTLACILIYEF